MNVQSENMRLYQTYADKMNKKSTDQIRDATLSFLYKSNNISNEDSPGKFNKIISSSMYDSRGLPQTDSQREIMKGRNLN